VHVCMYVCIISFFTSCTGEVELNARNENFEKDKFCWLAEKTRVEDGKLVIDANSFFEVLHLLSEMTEDELDKWEEKIGFVSYRTILRRINYLRENDNLDAKELIERFPNTIVQKDSTIYPLIESTIDQIICNAHGEYYTSGVFNKWTPDKLIMVFEPDKDKTEYAVSLLKSEPEKGIYLFSKEELIASKFDCLSFYKTYKQDDNKRIYLQVEVRKIIVGLQGFPFNTKIEQYYAGWKAWGEERNWLGNWKQYYTNIRVSEAKYSVIVPIKNQYQPDPNNDAYTLSFWDSPIENVSYDDIEVCSRHYFIGHQIKTEFNKPGIPEPKFERVHVYAESRGVKPGVQVACSPW